jgi:hypothetical protein
MDEVKHTPGPWIVTLDAVGSASLVVRTKEEPSVDSGRVAWIPNRPQKQENANLIAAAPEMLAMLKHLVAEYQVCKQCLCDRDDPADDWECDGCQLVRLIYKAEGVELLRCCICNKTIRPYGQYTGGNNAQPVADGRCCDLCNRQQVIPARLIEVEGRRYEK